MEQPKAFMNFGRWIFRCPRCGTALEAKEEGVVCGVCWTHVRATAFVQTSDTLLRPMPDQELRVAAVEEAKKAGELWKPVFPSERSEIEAILRMRPLPSHMNWTPAETVEDLRGQNIERGDPLPEKKKGRK